MDYNKLTKDEQFVLYRALAEYRKRVGKQKQNKLAMSKKKFNYGNAVVKKGVSIADSWFGLDNEQIGIVVGHYDIDGTTTANGRDMYRVYYSEFNSYTGADAEHLELYEGEIPEHLKKVEWNQIEWLDINLK